MVYLHEREEILLDVGVLLTEQILLFVLVSHVFQLLEIYLINHIFINLLIRSQKLYLLICLIFRFLSLIELQDVDGPLLELSD